jgi:hypothetical protein
MKFLIARKMNLTAGAQGFIKPSRAGFLSPDAIGKLGVFRQKI